MSTLSKILDTFRNTAMSEREKGTYFEELVLAYFQNEASYKDLYDNVWTYADWAKEQGLDQRDTGIDLVARTAGTGEFHAIQCKLYAEDYKLQKKDIDSFFTASGKSTFSHRIIVSTTNNWSDHAEEALKDQQPPVSKIDLFDLENSQIDWSKYQPKKAPVLKPKKQLREHQKDALRAVKSGLQKADRGKLIMACGTGKTFTSLKIAEEIVGKGGKVLFLVPSLALLSQSLTEWTQESSTLIHSFAVCSDSAVGKKNNKKENDEVKVLTHELRYPATTNAKSLAKEFSQCHDIEHMSVVFSTYHSIDVISKAQKEYGLADFDLIICDEAHRTTGATFEDEEESNFVRVHDADFIKSSKRLYMTATPKVYGYSAKIKAEQGAVELCSMDNEELYGKNLYVITFSRAVALDLLVDYKVIVLAVSEDYVHSKLQKLLNSDSGLMLDDATRLVGCWKALAKQDINKDLPNDQEPMKRAVAFCQVIEPSTKGKKVSSKKIADKFQKVVEDYQEAERIEPAARLNCEADHVDGSMNASEKEAKLAWLKAETSENTCRILSNVRCLSEGVDVPALDAVMFLTPKNSQIDVVQSVGRVMRKAEGKRMGYVILPVVIPAGVEPHDALNDNKTYKTVWEILQALRSHDDEFDAGINKLELNYYNNKKIEVIVETEDVKPKSKTRDKKKGSKSGYVGREQLNNLESFYTDEMTVEINDLERAIYAKIVEKCGTKNYWGNWAKNIAEIAQTHILYIKGILSNNENTQAIKAFKAFTTELRDDLNDSITDADVIEMLANTSSQSQSLTLCLMIISLRSITPFLKLCRGY